MTYREFRNYYKAISNTKGRALVAFEVANDLARKAINNPAGPTDLKREVLYDLAEVSVFRQKAIEAADEALRFVLLAKADNSYIGRLASAINGLQIAANGACKALGAMYARVVGKRTRS